MKTHHLLVIFILIKNKQSTTSVYLGSKIALIISKVKCLGQESKLEWQLQIETMLQLYQMVKFIWNSLVEILPPVNVTAAFAPEKGE